ncbi:hypothetical protein F2Q69_00012028 [Brassica cretica]|uniref:Uncharacterized protein n=1 Tax=Brassica cretica TaxID=69181 RepID=A0A8S9QTX1_BRACR|nr:hypothetical protein F2Q69_00012028 [Brassica cretica]
MDYNTLYPTGKDRLNISSYPYDKTLWSLYSSRPFCYARSLGDLIVGLQPDGLNRTTKDQRRAETNGRGTAPIGSRCRELSRACFFSRTVASGRGFGLSWTQADLRLRTLITDRERLKLSLIRVELDQSLQAGTQTRTI